MFRHRSFWIILLLTAIVWLMATMSENSDHPVRVSIQWEGYDTARNVVIYADTVLPVTINTNSFQSMAHWRTLSRQPYRLEVQSDTIVRVSSLLLDDIVRQLDLAGVKNIVSPVESLRLSTAARSRRGFVPNLSAVQFQFDNRCGLSGEPLFEPDTVWLYSDSATLGRIRGVAAADTILQHISDSGWHTVALNPAWRQTGDVHSSAVSLRIYLPVAPFVEKTFTLAVKPVCADKDLRLRLIPERVNVTLWVPAQREDQYTADQLEASVRYTPGTTASTLPVLVTRYPSGARLKSVQPSTLQYVAIRQ